jgi:hypothetical protein
MTLRFTQPKCPEFLLFRTISCKSEINVTAYINIDSVKNTLSEADSDKNKTQNFIFI